MNEAKERAYKKIKQMFADYIRASENGWSELANEYQSVYSGGCRIYEEVFEEEFLLTPEDRREILGVQENECEDFIRHTFLAKGCKGIETGCFFKMAAQAGLYKPGEYNSVMSKVLQKMVNFVPHFNDKGEVLYYTFELV